MYLTGGYIIVEYVHMLNFIRTPTSMFKCSFLVAPLWFDLVLSTLFFPF